MRGFNASSSKRQGAPLIYQDSAQPSRPAIPSRTLPIRIKPMRGEALDSWIETIASRYKAAFGDVADSIGLTYNFETRWMVDLTRAEVNAIADTTGVDHTTITATTLRHYDGHGLRITPGARRLDPNYPWGKLTTSHSRSRYCPHCLADNEGRWQLAWRLGWSFACVTHRCLLVDLCPQCHRQQRRFTHPYTVVPRPGHCALATNKPRTRCGADLSTADSTALSDDHPILIAQHVINTVLTGNTCTFDIYSAKQPDAEATLHDIAVIAARVATHAAQHPHSAESTAELVAACANDRNGDTTISARRLPRRPSIRTPDRAVQSAVQAATALKVVTASTIQDAGTILVANVGHPTVAGAETTLRWGLGCSESLAAVQIKAFCNDLPPRTAAALPSFPIDPSRARARHY